MWIELKGSVKINGVQRQPGFRTEYPRAAALALISNERAVAVQGPHEDRNGRGYPVGKVPTETTDPEKDDAVKLEEKPDGEQETNAFSSLSEETEETTEAETEEVERSEETTETESPSKGTTLRGLDFTSVGGIGPSTAEKIEDTYEDMEAFREADLTEIDGISKARAEKLRELDGDA